MGHIVQHSIVKLWNESIVWQIHHTKVQLHYSYDRHIVLVGVSTSLSPLHHNQPHGLPLSSWPFYSIAISAALIQRRTDMKLAFLSFVCHSDSLLLLHYVSCPPLSTLLLSFPSCPSYLLSVLYPSSSLFCVPNSHPLSFYRPPIIQTLASAFQNLPKKI